MNETCPNLVTTYSFKGGKEFVVKMSVVIFEGYQKCLELSIMDKCTAENWQSSYDMAYIENLTRKTGNYKQFEVFVMMLKSGLLKTSECITLDLLTFEDLELLRTQQIDKSTGVNHRSENRRYLILTYSVEFDRIHYPLPLDYCGPPDPIVLQGIIKKLKIEIERLQSTKLYKDFQKRIEYLTIANQRLVDENRKLVNSGKDMQRLLIAVKNLEKSVAKERATFRTQIQNLRSENAALALRIQQLSECAVRRPVNKIRLQKRQVSPVSNRTRLSNGRRNRSRSPSMLHQGKTSLSSPITQKKISSYEQTFIGSASDSFKSWKKNKLRESGTKEFDIGNLESRIHMLQRMLKEGINLN